MGFDSELYAWLLNAMLILGVLLFILGLWILINPSSFLRIGQSLNRWVATDDCFEFLDKPRYQERAIYKHHRLIGFLVFLGALYTLVMLLTAVTVDMMVGGLPAVGNAFWSEWFYGTLYYLLLAATLLAVAAGVIIFARPSLLKGVEGVLNRWIVSERRLKKLDERHEIAIEVLPGNPRLFGLAVALGGAYMVLSMAVMLL